MYDFTTVNWRENYALLTPFLLKKVKIFIDNEKIEHKIARYQSNTLITTSSLVVIPIYVAYNRGYYFYMVTSFGTGICSILYWYNPIHGWRRNLDLLYAKYSFIVYFISGIFMLQPGICNMFFILPHYRYLNFIV